MFISDISESFICIVRSQIDNFKIDLDEASLELYKIDKKDVE